MGSRCKIHCAGLDNLMIIMCTFCCSLIMNSVLLAGFGFQLYIVKKPSCIVENILKKIKTHVPGVQLESNIGAELSFVLPKEQSVRFEELFADLERNQDSLGIGSFGVSAPSLEKVFLKLVS